PIPLEILREALLQVLAGVEAEGLPHRREEIGGPFFVHGPDRYAHQASPAASVVSVVPLGAVVAGAASPAAERAFSTAVSRSETAWSKASTASRRRVPSSSDWRPSSASSAAAAAVVTAVRIVSWFVVSAAGGVRASSSATAPSAFSASAVRRSTASEYGTVRGSASNPPLIAAISSRSSWIDARTPATPSR